MTGRRRKIVAMLIVAVAGLALLGVAVALPRLPAILEAALERALERRGFAPADLSVRAVGWSGATLEALRLGGEGGLAVNSLRVAYSPAGLWQGRLDRVIADGVRLSGRLDEDGVSLGVLDRLAAGGGTAASADTALPAREIVVRDGDLRLETGQGPLRIGFDTTITAREGGALHLAGTIRPTLPPLAVGGRVVEVEPGAIAIDGWLDPDTLAWRGTADGEGVSADAADPALAARGFAFRAEAQGTGGQVSAASVRLSGEVLDPNAAPLFAPVRLAGEAHLAGDRVRFTGRLADRSGTARFDVDGHHRLATGEGEARITSRGLVFAPDGLQPQALLPALRGVVAAVSGSVDLNAAFEWRPGSLSSRLELRVSDGAAQTHAAALSGINGTVTFDSLLPPSTLPDQTVDIGLLNPGLPLRDGRITFTLLPDRRLRLSRARWPLAGGEISVAPTTVALGAERQRLVLRVREVELAQLLDLFALESLSVTGKVGGTIPVVIEDGAVSIRNGRLATEGGGVVRYAGGGGALAQAGENANLLLRALEDFRYSSLAVEVSGEVAGELDLVLHLSGANPALYGGYPFELNFTVGGALASMLRQGLVGYRIPDSIRRQLEQAE